MTISEILAVWGQLFGKLLALFAVLVVLAIWGKENLQLKPEVLPQIVVILLPQIEKIKNLVIFKSQNLFSIDVKKPHLRGFFKKL